MKRLAPDQIARIRAYRQRGYSGEQIGRFMGLCGSTVRKYLVGIPMPPETKVGFLGMRSRVLRDQARIVLINQCLAAVRA